MTFSLAFSPYHAILFLTPPLFHVPHLHHAHRNGNLRNRCGCTLLPQCRHTLHYTDAPLPLHLLNRLLPKKMLPLPFNLQLYICQQAASHHQEFFVLFLPGLFPVPTASPAPS